MESCLSQDYRPIEVLVFDGGSTDGTVDVLKSFEGASEIRWVSEPDRGVVDAVNKGLSTARGDILAIQSSDDYFLPGALDAAVSALEEAPALAFVYGDVEYIDAVGEVTGRTLLGSWNLRAFLARDIYVNQAGAFFRAWAAREIGSWDEDVPYAADSDYWLRMGLRFPAKKIDRLLARYRYHEAQRDKAGTRPARDWERAIRKRIEAREVAPDLLPAARRGIHLTWHHYTPESDWKARTLSLYRALFAEPGAVLSKGFPRRELLPGREPIWKLLSRTKRRLGTLAFDRPRFAWPLFLSSRMSRRWVGFHNREEQLVGGPLGIGFDCDWRWTSDLTLAKVFPWAGNRLLRAALDEWPVELEAPVASPRTGEPDVSFIVGHRGEERIPLLLATLASLRGQKGCATEILVVEQWDASVLEERLPAGVRRIHQVPPRAGMPYSRSWAFNRGVREARGRFVVLHDNDVLAPAGYAAEVLRLGEAGYEAMRLQRFLFYLDQKSTAHVCEAGAAGSFLEGKADLEFVRQNCVGATIAVSREAYQRIGGHDEAFLGWGGEDNEFYDRCRQLRLHPWGYLPFVHLWHAPQTGKLRPEEAVAALDEAMAIPREERIRRLAALPFGALEGPLPGRNA